MDIGSTKKSKRVIGRSGFVKQKKVIEAITMVVNPVSGLVPEKLNTNQKRQPNMAAKIQSQ